ncbi:MAG: dockerin type I repeat-containing protein [Dehalococcoidia bacterium]
MHYRRGGSTLIGWARIAVGALVLAAVASFLFLSQSDSRTEAIGGGPEMRLAVNDAISCTPGDPPQCDVAIGAPFTLTIEVVEAPANGYVQFMTVIILDEDLTYGTPKPPAAEEIVWPDREREASLRAQRIEGFVEHGAITGFGSPLPVSHHVGSIVEVVLNCSEAQTPSNLIDLLPAEVNAIPETFGSFFLEPGEVTPIIPKVSDLEINCVEAPTPTLTGDVSCNGVVTAVDVALALQHIAGLLGALPCPVNADVNGDGQVTVADTLLILQYIAGLLSVLG